MDCALSLRSRKRYQPERNSAESGAEVADEVLRFRFHPHFAQPDEMDA